MKLGPYDRETRQHYQPGAAGSFECVDAIGKIQNDSRMRKHRATRAILPGLLDQYDIQCGFIPAQPFCEFSKPQIDFVGPIESKNGYAPQVRSCNTKRVVPKPNCAWTEAFDLGRCDAPLGTATGGDGDDRQHKGCKEVAHLNMQSYRSAARFCHRQAAILP